MTTLEKCADAVTGKFREAAERCGLKLQNSESELDKQIAQAVLSVFVAEVVRELQTIGYAKHGNCKVLKILRKHAEGK